MNRKLSIFVCVVMLGFPGFTHAQSASGIIAPSRMIDWSAAGVIGGIPNRSTVCATLSPGASASQINSAIASCPSGQVVSLKAGTYNLSSGIDFGGNSDVTLRGAGPNQTLLVFSGGVSCSNSGSASVCIQGTVISFSSPANAASWTGGYSAGSTQVTLSDTNNLSVGSTIDFDQLNDSSDPGGVFVCDAQGTCSQEGTSYTYRTNRAQNQVAIVTGISGNTVTISPGIYASNWRSSQSPQAYWPTTTIQGDGIEGVSIDNTNSSATNGIEITAAKNCWIKNVRTLNVNRSHVLLNVATAHVSVVDSYFYGTQSGTTSEYGFENDRASDNLVQNNIFQHIVTPFSIMTAEGDVYAYNYALDHWYTKSSNWEMQTVFLHGAGAMYDLFEGNNGDGYEAEDIHGTKDLQTIFRNYLTGRDNSTKTSQTIPIVLYTYMRYFNVIGNVLGTPGYHTEYEDLAPSGTNANRSIYTLGWSGNTGTTSSAGPDDPLTIATLMRWGNYDVATGAVHWDSSEIPSAISKFANVVPSTHTLPASFYLAAKPGWWGTPWGASPWPAIGPDVTGGPGPGGHAYDIPAQLCYANSSKNSSGILDFNADSCYSSSPAPTAPTGLSALPH